MYPWNCCRLCLSTDYLNPIFSVPEKHEIYTRIVLYTCGVQVQINDTLPQQICTSCVTHINENYKFRKKCAKTQQTLKARCERGEFIKTEFELKSEGTAAIHINDDDLESDNDIEQTDHGKSESVIHKNLKTTTEIDKIKFLNIDNSSTINNIDDLKEKDKINHNNIDDSNIEQFKHTHETLNSDIDVTNEFNLTIRRSKRNVKKRIEIVDDEMAIDDSFCDNDGEGDTTRDLNKHIKNRKLSKNSKSKPLKKEKREKTERREVESQEESARGPVECKYCHKKLSSRLSIPNHYKIHTGFNIVCEHCGKKFISRRILLMHCRARHGYEKTDKCRYCDYRASNADQVKIHERLHTGEKPFVCKDCGAAFIRSSTYKQHIATHLTEKNVQCDQCPALFKSVTLMKIHKNKHKPNQYAFKCRVCNNSFVRRRNVTRHLERIHKLQPDPGLLERVRIGSGELDKS